MCDSDPFWDTDFFWNSTTPRVSKCFQETAINILPTSILLLGVLLNLSRKKKDFVGTITKLAKLRIGACSLVTVGYFAWLMHTLEKIHHGYAFDQSLTFSLPLNSTKIILYVTFIWMLRQEDAKKMNGVLWTASVFEGLYSAIRTYHIFTDTGSNWTVEWAISLFQLIACPLLFLAFTLDNSSWQTFNESGLRSRDQSSFCSKLFTGWFMDMLAFGRKKALNYEDLPGLIEGMESSKLSYTFQSEFSKQKPRSTETSHRFIKSQNVLMRLFWKEFSLALLLSTLQQAILCLLPLIMKLFLRYMNSSEDEPNWHGYLSGFTMILVAMIAPFLKFHADELIWRSHVKVSVCLKAAIYGKILRLRRIAWGKFFDGEILNLMSIDTNTVSEIIQHVADAVSSQVGSILSIVMLYTTVGNAAVVGLSVWILILVPMFLVAKSSGKLVGKMLPITDKRIKLINEILNGIKSVKMYAWEECFMEELTRLRDMEMEMVRKIDNILSLTTFGWTFGPVMATLAIVVFQWTCDRSSFSVESVFIMLPLVGMLCRPFGRLPLVSQQILTALVSFKRIDAFLNLNEPVDFIEKKRDITSLEIVGASFSWARRNNHKSNCSINGEAKDQEMVQAGFRLQGVELKARIGDFVCIIGPVGSGKTSLLNALLGEMKKIQGDVTLPASKTIAFVPQDSWTQNMTFRENILFGKKYDEEWYRQILTACELWPDIAILGHGDQSEIGESGINLSGGQKQRISLARAVYQNADIYILDDCLSAVDAHVSKRLYEKVLSSNTGLIKSKTRIMATHRLEFLSEVDKIIVLDEGSVRWSGKFDELLKSDSIGPELLEIISTENSSSDPESDQKQGSTSNKTGQKDLVSEERMEAGSISREVMTALWNKSPKLLILVLIVFAVACFSISIFARMILLYWTEVPSSSEAEGDHYFHLYIVSSFLEAFFLLVALVALGEIFIQSVTGLYKDSQIAVLYSPQRFFDTTPIGRILNRFSQDINSLDMQARMILKSTFWSMSSLVPAIIGSTIQTPMISIMVIVMTMALIYVWNFVVPAYHRLKRLESVSRSPLYSYFRETLSGSTCIRTFQAEERFTQEFHKKLDSFANCTYLLKLTSSWRMAAFGIVSSSLYIFIAALGIWNKGRESAAGIGLLLSYAVKVNEMVAFFFSFLTDLEILLISAERLHEFSQLPAEGERFGKPENLPDDWPVSGALKFHEYSASYSKGLSPTLKEVTFSINEREKIGIVGRTGAGKSSLTLALYRLIERLQGSIMIDGADISNIGLFHVRSALSIIPQDPVIFSGTLRFNLDPFKKYSDTEIWRCLELAQLKSYFDKFGQGLDYVIEEAGKNLSTGQKQLMCLSRSILKKSKIIVLDEATSSIDMETDSLIQETLRTEFGESTMLIVAHRLNTVINCDRVMVMDEGRLVEFDSPQSLLADSSSRFFALAKESQLLIS